MMTDKQRLEYAEELINLADQSGGIPDPQILIDTMARLGTPSEVDDQVAILNLVSELLHNREQEDDDSTEAEFTPVEEAVAGEVQAEGEAAV